MSATLMMKDRSRVGVLPEALFSNLLSPKKVIGIIQLVRATLQCVSYSGRYSIEDDTVIHHVDVASYPDWVGMNLLRQMTLENDMLILEVLDTQMGRARLVWKREGKPV
ncbi:hypothetical protein WM23_22370 [Burkholderia ubonensis]|nr:hypothetical protein WM23_22370 [Burkholderia ubonensis]